MVSLDLTGFVDRDGGGGDVEEPGSTRNFIGENIRVASERFFQ